MTMPAANESKAIPHVIGGKHTLGTSSRLGDVYNPATGKVVSHVPLASRA
jgi:malonate-semialdehyde dehydrogenase (acetylating)/methylmalonate-semialdehyde dehydrogenase